MRKWLRKFRPLLVAFGALVSANCLDIISTELVMAYVPGAIEQNPWMRDPGTWKFAVLPAVFIKLFGLLAIDAPMGTVIYAVTKDVKWAAIPMLVSVFYLLSASAHNLLVLGFK